MKVASLRGYKGDWVLDDFASRRGIFHNESERDRAHSSIKDCGNAAMASKSVEIDHYRTLQISEEATQQEIKQSYRRLAKALHPDTQNAPNDAVI